MVSKHDAGSFYAGVLRVAWDGVDFALHGRPERVWPARIVEIGTESQCMRRGDVNGGLCGLIVRAPDGVLSRITGVESSCIMHLFVGVTLGILLVPVEEP